MIQRRIHYAAIRNEAREAAVERAVRIDRLRRDRRRARADASRPRRRA